MSITRRSVVTSTKNQAVTTEAKAPLRRGLDDAVKHCLQGWIPFNTNTFTDIQDKFKRGEYDRRRERLLQDLKADVGLYTYVFKAISEYCEHIRFNCNPIRTLEQVDGETLKTILLVSEGSISAHSLQNLPKPQALRLKHTLISTSTAELFAEKSGVDPEMTYAAAMLRQLGLMLISFNYPNIYSRAVQTHASGKGILEAVLQSSLGFSPQTLAIRMANEWGISTELSQALFERHDALESSSQAGVFQGDSLQEVAKFCKIGEAVARINDPENFPSASQEWSTVIREVEYYLGDEGQLLLSSHLEESCAQYVTIAPKIFSADLSPERNVQLANYHYSNFLYKENFFIHKCKDEVKEQFREAYTFVRHGSISAEAINYFANELIPYLGFDRGCVYLLDAKGQVLKPTLRLGNTVLTRYRPISLTSYDGIYASIIDALYNSIPIRQEEVVIHGTHPISHISWNIGTAEKGGVLHLELGEGVRQLPVLEIQNIFKACRQFLNDCLHLK